MPAQFIEQTHSEQRALRVLRCGLSAFLTRDLSLPEHASLAQCWQAEGSFLFCAQDFDDAALSAQCQKLTAPRFLWVENPSEPVGCWRTRAIACAHGVLPAGMVVGVGPHRLTLRAGARVRCTDEEILFEGADAAFSGPSISLRAPAGAAVRLGVAGEHPGALRMELLADPGGGELLRQLDVGMRFAAAPEQLPRREGLLAGFLARQEATVLAVRSPVRLSCRFHLAALRDGARTALQFPQNLDLETELRDILGHPVRAQTGKALALVLEKAPRYRYTHQDNTRRIKTMLRLGLQGDIRLLCDGAPLRLLCGLTGTEFFCGTPSPEVELVNGQPALLPEEDGAVLESACETAYLRMDTHAAYHSQSATSPFYTDSADALSWAPLALFWGIATPPPVPLFPYGACRGALLNPTMAEARLQTARQAILRQSSAANQSGSDGLVVSAQGLLGGIKNGALDWIGVANTTDQATREPSLRLSGLGVGLRAALQDVAPAVCYDTPEALLRDAQIDPEAFYYEVAGWRFLTAPQAWRPGDGAAMLLKYHTGESLLDRFGTTKALLDAVADARDPQGTPKPNCQALLQAAEDPNFQGVLILNCPVEVRRNHPGYLPEWSMLLDSIDPSLLRARYVIFYRSEITQLPAGAAMGVSGACAFLDYSRPSGSGWKDEQTFRFTTTGLRLLVRDGAIAALESESELMVGALFGSTCDKPSTTAGNSLLLDGCFSQGRQRFTLREPGFYSLTGSALTGVELDSVVCVADQKDARFVLGGQLHFRELAEADVFSYGAAAGAVGGGLRFEGLLLTYAPPAPMQMRYGGLLLRPNDSQPRPNGLAGRFPVGVLRLCYGEGKNTPQQAGFASLRTPLRQSKLESTWFGLEYELPLGAMGALAPAQGPRIQFLFAWSPGEKEPALYSGVRLGLEQWRIQGLFELGFSSVSLELDREAQPHQYSLRLDQFCIKLLGLRFPAGANRLFLFSSDDGRTLGWYCAYEEEKKELQDGKTT